MVDYPQVTVESRAALREWLAANHEVSAGIWLVRFKQDHGPHVSYDDVVEEALAFGWIDSQPRKLDEGRSQLLLTPRRRGSRWSAVNRQRIEKLQSLGLMTPAGEAAVRRAQQDGTWTALDPVEQLTEPQDLKTALDAQPSARANWDAFPRSTRRAILEWIAAAKRPDTRAKRVRQTVEDAAVNVRANQWRQPKGAKSP